MIECKIKKVLAIGKKEWPAMRGMPGMIKFRDRDRNSAVRAHPAHGRLHVRGQDDYAVRSPCAAAALRSVTNNLRRAPVEIDSFELSVSEKTERLAVRRPERKVHIFCSRKSTCLELVQGTNPEHDFAVGPCDSKREVRTIGREHRRTREIACQAERAAFRRCNDGANGPSRSGTIDEESEECPGCEGQHNRRDPGETRARIVKRYRRSRRDG